jgi:protein-disulfide isomerase
VLAALLMTAAGSGFAWSEYNRRLEAAHATEYLARWQEYESDWQSVYNRYMAQPQVQIPILTEDSIRGNPDAPHTVVVFSDFQCPHCRNLDRQLREKLAPHPDYFRVVFKHFPMNRDCNRYLQGRTNPAACAAAATVEAAYILGGDEAFWAMHDTFFKNPAALSGLQALEKHTREVCEQISIDYDELKAQFTTRSVWARVDRHIEQASGAGIRATPVVFLNDRRVTGWVNTKFWDYLVYLEQQKEGPARRPGQTLETRN